MPRIKWAQAQTGAACGYPSADSLPAAPVLLSDRLFTVFVLSQRENWPCFESLSERRAMSGR